jgi:hypothetical protein
VLRTGEWGWGVTLAEGTGNCRTVIAARLYVGSARALRCIRWYNNQSFINKYTSIPRHLRSCHAPIVLDRAVDYRSPSKPLEREV